MLAKPRPKYVNGHELKKSIFVRPDPKLKVKEVLLLVTELTFPLLVFFQICEMRYFFFLMN